MSNVAVIGASGFVGQAVQAALEKRDHSTLQIRAPRIFMRPGLTLQAPQIHEQLVRDLAHQLHNVDAVVCAAGIADASSRDIDALYGANAAIPSIVAAAANLASVKRFVHISSAVVQGAAPQLDATERHAPTSPYGRSKAAGEVGVLTIKGPTASIIYRPPSVHSPERRVTQAIFRIANSPLSTVVSPGDRPTPQAHIANVGDAIACLASHPETPPPIVIHPWEGWTTGSFLTLFSGGRIPKQIPRLASRPIEATLAAMTRSDRLAPNARRLHMLWFGQMQEESWLDDKSWTAPAGRTAWEQLVTTLRTNLSSHPRTT